MWAALVGSGIIGCWWAIANAGDVRRCLPVFYTFYALAFGLYLLALWGIARWERLERPESGSRVLLAWLLLVAVAARLFLLGTTPTLSDDVYRYRWDGRVQLAGLDPYRYPPDAPELASLRDAQDRLINFPHLRTVYPPVTQAAFRLGALMGGTITAQKAVFVASELLTVVGLLIILHCRQRSLLWLAAYAWHPLVILEIAGSGHNDALGVGLLWLGVAAWESRRWFGAAAAWSASFLAKFVAAALVPWWWCRHTARRELAVCIALSVVPLVLHPTAITALMDSLSKMGARSESNASVVFILEWLTGSAIASRLIGVGAFVGFLLWWARRCDDPIRYLGGVLGAAALLTPVLHPWYLLWLVPCFCVWRAPWLVALSGTAVLSYTVWPGWLDAGRWVVPTWAHALEYAPVVVLGVWGIAQWKWPSSFRLAMKPAPSARC